MLAAGYRYNATGALTSVGAGGWCWQSSSYAADNCNAGQYGFRESYVNPLNDANRADAVSVRCVQASAGVAFYFSSPALQKE